MCIRDRYSPAQKRIHLDIWSTAMKKRSTTKTTEQHQKKSHLYKPVYQKTFMDTDFPCHTQEEEHEKDPTGTCRVVQVN